MSLQDAIDNLNEEIKKKSGVCSLCGEGGIGYQLMTFTHRDGRNIVFCIDHSPWYPVSEDQRRWSNKTKAQIITMEANGEDYWNSCPDNPLPSWCKNSTLNS